MSVAMTAEAVVERRKTVTRRLGWWTDRHGRRILRVGDDLTLCRKVQGRKPGEPLDRLAEVSVLTIRREPLSELLRYPTIGPLEVEREGFPGMAPAEFVRRFFTDAQGVDVDTVVTRIEWKYLDRLCGWCGYPNDCRVGRVGDSRHHRLCCVDQFSPICRQAVPA